MKYIASLKFILAVSFVKYVLLVRLVSIKRESLICSLAISREVINFFNIIISPNNERIYPEKGISSHCWDTSKKSSVFIVSLNFFCFFTIYLFVTVKLYDIGLTSPGVPLTP